MPRHLMLVPSLACPASCAYCFGPHEAGPNMDRKTIESVVRWQESLGDGMPLDVTFHGGEPLIPGTEFYRMALPLLRNGLAPRKIGFAIQSNMWLVNDELLELFSEYGVSIGTSLDGPEYINDAQRGEGYFRRTMAGIARAHHYALSVGCICTFTDKSAKQAGEVFDFFVQEGLNFSIHAALPSLKRPQADAWSLSPEAHGELLVEMLERYLKNMDKVRIGTLDSLCRSVSAQRGSICTFTHCLGSYLAVGPGGEIYPCQRFAGMQEYQLGSVQDCPSLETLSASPAWRRFRGCEEQTSKECGDCLYLNICKGGCTYNALASNGRSSGRTFRDSQCAAYRRIFSHIIDRATEEVFADENMSAVLSGPGGEAGLLRRGKLIALMNDSPHPCETAHHARHVLAAVALATQNSPEEAIDKLRTLRLITDSEHIVGEISALNKHLRAPTTGLNNLYLHITFACPLSCTHCYAQAGPERKGNLSVDDVVRACHQANKLHFRHVVITGGEPLVHPRREALLDALAGIRREVKPLLTVLRTSLALPVHDDLLWRIGHSTDEVAVSVDGDRVTHDARRGAGTYDLTIKNLRALSEMGYTCDLSLATVLPLRLVHGPPGDAVRALAKELGIRRIRFRPVLPLGRADELEPDIVPETVWAHIDSAQIVAYGFRPVASCGIGQNLYVEPDGSAYPCYAWHGNRWLLGNINQGDGLQKVILSDAFKNLAQHTVNTNLRCRRCALRYLCGGACRAWKRLPSQEQVDLDAPPTDCSALHARALSILAGALSHLGISPDQWIAADLPFPQSPPIKV